MAHGTGDDGHMKPRGRLVLIAESTLTAASRRKLRDLLGAVMGDDDVTMVSGLNRASVLQAGREGGGSFYNRDYITPEEAFSMMNWREVWLVAGGQVWQLEHKA